MFGCNLQFLQVKVRSTICHICEWAYRSDLVNKSEIHWDIFYDCLLLIEFASKMENYKANCLFRINTEHKVIKYFW